MRAAIIALCCCAALAGCARPDVPKEVRIPVPVPCISAETRAKLDADQPAPMRPLTGNAETDVAIIAAQALRWKAYAEEVQAALKGC